MIAWAGYELAIRLDDFNAWLSGLRHLSEVRGQSFWENMRIMMEDPAMAAMVWRMVYLALCVLVGLLCLLFRNRKGWGVFLIPCSAGLAAWGWLQGLLGSGWLGLAALAPFALMLVGGFLNITTGRRKPPLPDHPPQGPYFRR